MQKSAITTFRSNRWARMTTNNGSISPWIRITSAAATAASFSMAMHSSSTPDCRSHSAQSETTVTTPEMNTGMTDAEAELFILRTFSSSRRPSRSNLLEVYRQQARLTYIARERPIAQANELGLVTPDAIRNCVVHYSGPSPRWRGHSSLRTTADASQTLVAALRRSVRPAHHGKGSTR